MKKGEDHKGTQVDKHYRKDEVRVKHFHTTPRNILMEIKDNPMLKRPRPIETPVKFKNKNKCCEYDKDYGHTTSKCRKLKRGLHDLTDEGHVNYFLRRK